MTNFKLLHKVRSKISVFVKLTGRSRLVLVVLLVGILGSAVLIVSHAATNVVATEPETGTIAAPAAQVTDATASAGKAIKFGAVPTGDAYPDASSTGPVAVGGCGTLVDSGPITVTSGTQGSPRVYQNLRITGDINVPDGTHDATIHCVDVIDHDATGSAVYLRSNVTRFKIDYSSIHGVSGNDNTATSFNNDRLQYAVAALGSPSFITLDHNNFYWAPDPIQQNGDNWTITNNYIHDLTWWSQTFYPAGGAQGDHLDPLQAYGGAQHLVIQHNHFEDGMNGTGWQQVTPISLFQDDPTPYNDVLVDDNLVAGGGYCFLGAYETSKGGSPPTNTRWTNNKLSTLFFSQCGSIGTGYHFPALNANGTPTGAGNYWSGNTWYDGPNKGVTVAPPSSVG